MKLASLLLCLLTGLTQAQGQGQKHSDLIKLESTDGKTIDAQLLSATYSQVTFKRLDSPAPFDLPLSKLTDPTVKTIREWTKQYNERTPLSFREFRLGMPSKIIDRMNFDGKLADIKISTSPPFKSYEFKLAPNYHEKVDPRILASSTDEKGTTDFRCGKLTLLFQDDKLACLTVSGEPGDSFAWCSAILNVLDEKYGKGKNNEAGNVERNPNGSMSWVYSTTSFVGLHHTEPDESGQRSGCIVFSEKRMLELFKEQPKSPPVTKGKF